MPETKQSIYNELSRTLTEHEGNPHLPSEDAEDLYNMLVKIQNHWEDTITAD